MPLEDELGQNRRRQRVIGLVLETLVISTSTLSNGVERLVGAAGRGHSEERCSGENSQAHSKGPSNASI
jgi:hypothetical protein